MPMDKAAAEKILAEGAAKIKALEAEMEALTGKDNKKARNQKSRDIADLKKGEDYVDAERVLAGKEPLSEKNKAPVVVEEKKEEKKEEVKEDVKKAKEKEKKEKKGKDEGGGISNEERKEMDKLKDDIVARKKELKDGGMTGGQMNKDEQIVGWVKRMNELKEKAGELVDKKAEKAEKKKKGGKDAEALENLKAEIEAYKEKLKIEFGYTKADINKDEDIVSMTKKLKEMKG